MNAIILVKAIQTCYACPSQWDAWDIEGRYWYLRFRGGWGTIGRDYLSDALSFETGNSLDGFITLEEFCKRIGIIYAPHLARGVAEFEEVPET